MITGTLSTGQKFTVPQTWEEVTVAQYVALQGKENNDKLAVLTGIDVELLNKVPQEDISVVWGVLSFLDEEIPYLPGAFSQGVVIALEPVALLERAKELLTKYPFWDCCPNVYAIYYGPKLKDFELSDYWSMAVDQYTQEVDNMPITEVYTPYIKITEDIARFTTRYKALYDKKPSDNEEAAGIHTLYKYGFFATLAEKCNHDPTRYEAMRRTLADTFYATLLYEKERNEFNKRLQEINNMTK